MRAPVRPGPRAFGLGLRTVPRLCHAGSRFGPGRRVSHVERHIPTGYRKPHEVPRAAWRCDRSATHRSCRRTFHTCSARRAGYERYRHHFGNRQVRPFRRCGPVAGSCVVCHCGVEGAPLVPLHAIGSYTIGLSQTADCFSHENQYSVLCINNEIVACLAEGNPGFLPKICVWLFNNALNGRAGGVFGQAGSDAAVAPRYIISATASVPGNTNYASVLLRAEQPRRHNQTKKSVTKAGFLSCKALNISKLITMVRRVHLRDPDVAPCWPSPRLPGRVTRSP